MGGAEIVDIIYDEILSTYIIFNLIGNPRHECLIQTLCEGLCLPDVLTVVDFHCATTRFLTGAQPVGVVLGPLTGAAPDSRIILADAVCVIRGIRLNLNHNLLLAFIYIYSGLTLSMLCVLLLV